MSEMKCSCETLERLEGASVNAYIGAFLEQEKQAEASAQNRFRCRVCGRAWEKRRPASEDDSKRPSLVKTVGES